MTDIAYYTVVYRVDGDNATHHAWWRTIRPLFMTDSKPVSIVVISKDNEITRLDRVRKIIDGRKSAEEKVEAIDAVMRGGL